MYFQVKGCNVLKTHIHSVNLYWKIAYGNMFFNHKIFIISCAFLTSFILFDKSILFFDFKILFVEFKIIFFEFKIIFFEFKIIFFEFNLIPIFFYLIKSIILSLFHIYIVVQVPLVVVMTSTPFSIRS